MSEYRTFTLAGPYPASSLAGSVNSTPELSSFSGPRGLAQDAYGNIYVADAENGLIRKITKTSVSVFAEGLNQVDGITVGPNGNIYATDTANHVIHEFTPAGVKTQIAGVLNTSGTIDKFRYPRGIVVDTNGDVFVADNHVIVVLRKNGSGSYSMSKYAGEYSTIGSSDGLVSNARFYNPRGLALDSTGNLLVCDTDNQTIRRIGKGTRPKVWLWGLTFVQLPDALIPASSYDAGTALSNYPADEILGSGYSGSARLLFKRNGVVDNSRTVYAIVNSNGQITPYTVTNGGTGYTSSPAVTITSILHPSATGATAVAIVRKGSVVGIVPTGDGGSGYYSWAPGAVTVTIAPPASGTTATAILGSNGNNSSTYGRITSFANSPSPSDYSAGYFDGYDLELEEPDELVVTTIAGSPSQTYPERTQPTDGYGPTARFNNPRCIAVAKDNSLLVTDNTGNAIRKIVLPVSGSFRGVEGREGTVSTILSTPTDSGLAAPAGIIEDRNGRIVFSDRRNNSIRYILPNFDVSVVLGLTDEKTFAIDGFPSKTISLTRGLTYSFSMDASVATALQGPHPFWIKYAAAGVYPENQKPPSAAWLPGIDQSVGEDAGTADITNNGSSLLPIIFTPDNDIPNTTLFYQCGSHNDMGGVIRLSEVNAIIVDSQNYAGVSVGTSGTYRASLGAGYIYLLITSTSGGQGLDVGEVTVTASNNKVAISSPQPSWAFVAGGYPRWRIENLAYYEGDGPQFPSGGAVALTISVPGNAIYAARTITLNYFTQSRQRITFAPIPAKNRTAPPFTVSPTVSSGLPLTISSSNPLVATVSGFNITLVGAGSTTITAYQTGNSTYVSTSLGQELVVGDYTTLTFDAIPDKVVLSGPFYATPTSTSNAPIVLTSSNPAVASVNGFVVTPLTVGTVIITASQAANATYSEATPISRTFLVVANKLSQTITLPDLNTPSKTSSSAPFTITATASSGLLVTLTSSNPAVASVSGFTITPLAVGSCLIIATQAGNQYYNSTSLSQLLTINPPSSTGTAQTIAISAISNKVALSGPFDVVATASSGLLVTLSSSNPSIASVSGFTITPLAEGSVVITATQAGNGTYASAITTVSFNVSAPVVVPELIPQTITFASISNKVALSGPFSAIATASSGLPVALTSSNPAVASVVGFTITPLTEGVVSITATQAGNTTYSSATVAQTFNVLTATASTQTIYWSTLPNGVVGTSINTLPIASSNLPVTLTSSNPSVASISGLTINSLSAGSVTITATQAGNSSIPAATPVTQNFNVSTQTANAITVTVSSNLIQVLISRLPTNTGNGAISIGSIAATIPATSSSPAWTAQFALTLYKAGPSYTIVFNEVPLLGSTATLNANGEFASSFANKVFYPARIAFYATGEAPAQGVNAEFSSDVITFAGGVKNKSITMGQIYPVEVKSGGISELTVSNSTSQADGERVVTITVEKLAAQLVATATSLPCCSDCKDFNLYTMTDIPVFITSIPSHISWNVNTSTLVKDIAADIVTLTPVTRLNNNVSKLFISSIDTPSGENKGDTSLTVVAPASDFYKSVSITKTIRKQKLRLRVSVSNPRGYGMYSLHFNGRGSQMLPGAYVGFQSYDYQTDYYDTQREINIQAIMCDGSINTSIPNVNLPLIVVGACALYKFAGVGNNGLFGNTAYQRLMGNIYTYSNRNVLIGLGYRGAKFIDCTYENDAIYPGNRVFPGSGGSEEYFELEHTNSKIYHGAELINFDTPATSGSYFCLGETPQFYTAPSLPYRQGYVGDYFDLETPPQTMFYYDGLRTVTGESYVGLLQTNYDGSFCNGVSGFAGRIDSGRTYYYDTTGGLFTCKTYTAPDGFPIQSWGNQVGVSASNSSANAFFSVQPAITVHRIL